MKGWERAVDRVVTRRRIGKFFSKKEDKHSRTAESAERGVDVLILGRYGI
jgi:hypothetical protein